MPTTWTAADPVEKIAAKLIREHHEHLIDANICYLFVDPPPKRNGKEIAGRASKIGDKLNAQLEAYGGPRMVGDQAVPVYDFLIEISEDHWHARDAAGRKALVDHELMHCFWKWDAVVHEIVDAETGETREETEKVFKAWTTRNHDIEAFDAVVARHGLWTGELANFADVVDSLGAKLRKSGGLKLVKTG